MPEQLLCHAPKIRGARSNRVSGLEIIDQQSPTRNARENTCLFFAQILF
jgi:hypothetical protein